MKKDSTLLAAMAVAVNNNPLMQHMRKVAYTPINYSPQDSNQTQLSLKEKAEQKRLRKQAVRSKK